MDKTTSHASVSQTAEDHVLFPGKLPGWQDVALFGDARYGVPVYFY